MSETQAAPTQAVENKFKISIQITQSAEGDLGLQVLGDAVKLVECRKMLNWALYRVNDEITVEMIKNMMDTKVKAHGFRGMSLSNLFK